MHRSWRFSKLICVFIKLPTSFAYQNTLRRSFTEEEEKYSIIFLFPKERIFLKIETTLGILGIFGDFAQDVREDIGNGF